MYKVQNGKFCHNVLAIEKHNKLSRLEVTCEYVDT